MKKIAFCCLVLLAFALPLSAGDTSGITVEAETVLQHVRISLERWSQTPFGGSTCGTVDCCLPSTGVSGIQCIDFANKVESNPELYARRMFTLLVTDADFDCHVFTVAGRTEMSCKVLPAPHPGGTALDSNVAEYASVMAAAD
jgi:hypothetical protein